MVIVSRTAELKRSLATTKRAGKKIGFVPTMGAFHEGHLSLIRACRKENHFCVVSIFVNPTQFGPAEDYQKYPRNLKKDAVMAKKEGADLIFAPRATEVYPDGYRTFVEVEGFSQKLCGRYRSGHFRGVATVILKLFNLVQPDKAYFGWKDAQQLIIIKKMAENLNLPVEIVGLPTVREPDGLAMSSRNRFLSPEERKAAPALYQTLLRIKETVESGKNGLKEAVVEARNFLRKNSLIKLQYLEAVDLKTLEPVKEREKEVLVAIAAFLGKTRLIDNIVIHGH